MITYRRKYTLDRIEAQRYNAVKHFEQREVLIATRSFRDRSLANNNERSLSLGKENTNVSWSHSGGYLSAR